MESKLRRYWDKVVHAIMRRWGDQVDEADLQQPMGYEQLCEYFGEKCNLAHEEARERVDNIIREIDARPPGM